MSNSIYLHPKLGVNPRLTYCPRCGGENGHLLLLGTTNKVYMCQGCGTPNIGKPKNGCGKCGHYDVPFERELRPNERLPGDFCGTCRQEMKEHRAEVAAGGVYFRCSDCPAIGVIRADHPFAKAVRKAHGIEAPDECGVEFSKAEGCPVCGDS